MTSSPSSWRSVGLLSWIETINQLLWSRALIILVIGAGLYFTLKTRFLQVRLIREMIRLMFRGKSSERGVFSFQALALSLSGRVGTGNIAGTATAIAFGGPGSIFWMWLIAIIGASTSFVESTLAQIYKESRHGFYRGGPAYYIEKGLGRRWYASIFAIASILAMSLLMPGIQSNSIALSMHEAFHVPVLYTAILIILLLAIIIFGGVKRIAQVAQYVVPFMAIGYLLLAFIIVILHASELPTIFQLIITSAFAMEPAFGGMLGMTILWGVKRGIYSNEAGQGTGAHAAAVAEASHPAKQGLVQAFSIYIDTLLVCSATALMILITGKYNTQAPDGSFLVHHLPNAEAGTSFTQAAIETVFPGFGAGFVAIALFFFAFTTIMAYYYIAETNLVYLLRQKKAHWATFILKLVLLVSVFYGCIHPATFAWQLGDIGLGIMVWINLLAILFLSKQAFQTLQDYEEQRKNGIDPQFDARKLTIEHADVWQNESQEKIS